MITSYELPGILEQHIPEAAVVNKQLKPLLQVFSAINNLSDLTASAVREHHYLLAGRCFRLAERFYAHGDRIIRNLIQYSFVPALPSFMPEDEAEKMFIKSLIPVSLYHLYEQEIGDGPE
jgi:hypothetical protein